MVSAATATEGLVAPRRKAMLFFMTTYIYVI